MDVGWWARGLTVVAMGEHISPWFKFAAVMFLLAFLGVFLEGGTHSPFFFWGTIGFVITGIILLILGFADRSRD